MPSPPTPGDANVTQPDQRTGLLSAIRKDMAANPRDPRMRTLLIMFRLAHAVTSSHSVPGPLRLCVVAVYRLLTESLWGVELRPKTSVGEALTIYHGFGLVVNDHSVIGNNVTLRHAVTIGHSRPGGGCPVIEDDVEVGAGAIIVGPVRVGRGALVGAGAVVRQNVSPGDIVAGNPAKVIGSVGDRPRP